jgi:hypothetical protein
MRLVEVEPGAVLAPEVADREDPVDKEELGVQRREILVVGN